MRSLPSAIAWATARLHAEYGVVCGAAWELGGPYHPSPGVTAEVVHPYAVEVTAVVAAPRQLRWIAVADLLPHPELLVDGHLQIAVNRAAHALGLLRAG